MPSPVRWLLLAPALAWSGWWLALAFQRWRYESLCAFICSPFIPPDMVDYYRRAFDWQTPLVWAALPLLMLPVVWLQRRRRAHGAA